MNKIFLVGRITAAPDMKTTQTGKAVVDFTLAVDRYVNGEKTADFIRVAAFDKNAENLCRYKTKGDQIAVSGSLRVDQYTDRDGNNRYRTYVIANEIEYIGGRTKPEDGGGSTDQATRIGAVPADDDEDFPF